MTRHGNGLMLRDWRDELIQAPSGSVRRPRARRRLLAVRRAQLAA